MPIVKMMDVVEVNSVAKAQDGTQIAITTSVADDSKRIIRGIPNDVDLNGKTEITLKSSTQSLENIDYISISHINEKGEYYGSQNFHKEENGQYKRYRNYQPNASIEQINALRLGDSQNS